MAYNQNNLALEVQPIAGKRVFQYVSADSIATVNNTGYISNGYQMGLRVQDLVRVVDTATPSHSLCVVISSNATTGAVNLSDGTTIAQTDGD